MGTRIFRVDVGEGARDFQASALEPGVPMLDRSGANYLMLRRWVGDMIAQPDWEGEHSVGFHIHPDDRGRLENVTCVPCTKADLEGRFKEDVEEIACRLNKVKAESSTEQLFLKVAQQAFARLTCDLEEGDFDTQFFKYREAGQPWRIIWCWGYQRSDLLPARAKICTHLDCQLLFVKRVKNNSRCPDCQKIPSKRVSRGGPISFREAMIALLLLLLLGGSLFAYLGRPQLVVTPEKVHGVPGSRIHFRVVDQRWFFYKNDVTDQVLPVSHNAAIAEFDRVGVTATARNLGNTQLSFHFDRRFADVPIVVAPRVPKLIRLEPANARLGPGTTVRVKVIGDYDDGTSVDLTNVAQLTPGDREIVFTQHGNYWEGAKVGSTKLKATYQVGPAGDTFEAEMGVVVADVEFKSLELSLSSTELFIEQATVMKNCVLDGAGIEYSVQGSSKLDLHINPAGVAQIDRDVVIAKTVGNGELRGNFNDLAGRVSFVVGDAPTENELPDVRLRAIELPVGAYRSVATLSDPNQGPPVLRCSSSGVVEIVGDAGIVGIGSGKTIVTITQGKVSTTVAVTVIGDVVKVIRLNPPSIKLAVGQSGRVRIEGITESGNVVDINPQNIDWVKQPLAHFARLDRERTTFHAMSETDRPQELLAVYDGRLQAVGTLDVVAWSGPRISVGGPVARFISYPPIGSYTFLSTDYLGPRALKFERGNLVVFEPAPGSILDGILPPGTILRDVDGNVFCGMRQHAIRDYFKTNPLHDGSVLGYLGDNGQRYTVRLTRRISNFPYDLIEVSPGNLTTTDFNATIVVDLKEEGLYRILRIDGAELTESKRVVSGARAAFVTDKIDRTENGRYKVQLERTIGEEVETFEIPFSLGSQ